MDRADGDIAGPTETTEAPAVPESATTAADDVAQAMDQIEAREATEADRDEIGELFKPHQEQLKAAGISEAAYVKRLVSIGQALEANPAATLQWLAQQYEVGGDQHVAADNQVEVDEGQVREMQGEWQSFVQGNPDANSADLKAKMLQELQRNPLRSGETTADGLKRIHEAAKGSSTAPAKPKQQAKPKRQPQKKQRQDNDAHEDKRFKKALAGQARWRAALKEAWDGLHPDEDRIRGS